MPGEIFPHFGSSVGEKFDRLTAPVRPTELTPSILRTDLLGYLQRGVWAYAFDLDSTLREYHGWGVPQSVVEHLHEFRTHPEVPALIAGINKSRPTDKQIEGPLFMIITNTSVRNSERNFLQVAEAARAIGAAVALTPEGRQERKPGSIMPLKALAFSGAKPEEVVIIGDNLADILGGNRAGMHAEWVERYGGADHPAKRHLVRRIESPLRTYWFVQKGRQLLHPDKEEDLFQRQDSPVADLLVDFIQDRYFDGEGTRHSRIKEDDERDYLQLPNVIAGYGVPDIDLPDDVLEAIPNAWHAPVTGRARRLIEPLHVGEFLYEHGNDIADRMTDYRDKAGPKIAQHLLEGQYIRARNKFVLAAATDPEGFFARRGKYGGTPEGADKDNRADKKLSRTVDEALAAIIPHYFIHVAARTVRDELINEALRPVFEELGVDVSAITASKLSTICVMVAQFLIINDLAHGVRPEDISMLPQYIATAAKWTSFALSASAYRSRYEKHASDEAEMEKIRARLIKNQST